MRFRLSWTTQLLLRAVVVSLLAVVALLGAAPAAFAHASLLTATPGDGAVLDEPPTEVSLTFTEAVTLGAGYLRVVDGDGDRVDTGNVTVDGAQAGVALQGSLPDGGYVISYRLISADSHPVSGGIAFAVGDAAVPSIDARGGQGVGTAEDPAVSVLYPTVRWVGYAGLALLAGVLLLGLIDPALRTAARARSLAWLGFDLALAGTVLGGLLHGPYAAGEGLGALFDADLMSATLETSMGHMTASRLVLIGALGVMLWEWFNAETDRRALVRSAAATVLAISVTHAAGGHAAADGVSWLSIPLTAAHLAAVSAWIGGLVLLLLVVGTGSPLRRVTQRAVAGQFSTVAGWLIAIVIGTGIAQAWVRVGSWEALFTTSYGRLLVAKSALLAAALIAAVLSRRLIGRGSAGHDAEGPDNEDDRAPGALPVRRLRRTMLVETAAGALAIALASVLVATPPATDANAVAEDTTIAFANGYTAQLSLDPARTGANTIHLYLFDRDNALAAQIDELTLTIENPVAQIGPLGLDAQHVGAGHFIAGSIELPASGTWTVSITFTEPGFGTVSEQGDIDVG